MRRRAAGADVQWIVTFSDLTAIILCFFVLSFSMSSVDLARWDFRDGDPQGALQRAATLPFTMAPHASDWRRAEFSSGSGDGFLRRLLERKLAVLPTDAGPVIEETPSFIEVHVGDDGTADHLATVKRMIAIALDTLDPSAPAPTLVLTRPADETLYDGRMRAEPLIRHARRLRPDLLVAFARTGAGRDAPAVGLRLVRPR
ncbi:MAG: hypothetical protein KDE35_18355 [Geminicoccaceae bacterium]|nr:hypothetical protein [Geminicoccaceae bacterium]